jgi:hypothetical protein
MPVQRRTLMTAALAASGALGSLATAQPATAAPAKALADADVRAIRGVVEAQLKAFAADDAARAYALASPAIQAQFGDAPNFLRMVREAYPVVYRPAATAFFRPEATDDGSVVQVVQMRDQAGRAWLATYQLQRDASQRWRISGCVVLPDEGKAT